MTGEMKERLRRMRLSGKSYAEICASLRLKESAVRTYCSRNGLTDRELRGKQNGCISGVQCQFCGAPIVQVQKQKPRKFCSDTCRMAWWAEHRDEMVRKAYYTIHCQTCGKAFNSYGNKERKYCSKACFFAAKTHGARA